jgi:serine protease AprX
VLKVLDSGGSGALSDGIAAVDEVIARKSEFNIRILNLSFAASGSSNGRDTLSQACNQATSRGLVVVVAAGNDGPNTRSVGLPSAAASVITVGAGADLGARGFYIADFSSRGPTSDGRIKPDLWAPGVSIRTAFRQGGYRDFTGTSFATPFVSGVVALMLDANPSLTPARVKTILTSTAQRWFPGGKNNDTGSGRLQAYQAITRAASITANLRPPDVPNLRSIRRGIVNFEEQSIEFTVLSTRFPVAVTCIVSNHPSGDVDLEIYSPSGRVVGRSATLKRQETVRFLPTETGTYRVRLTALGDTDYFLDLSGDLQ